jgi:hypothetical protein
MECLRPYEAGVVRFKVRHWTVRLQASAVDKGEAMVDELDGTAERAAVLPSES